MAASVVTGALLSACGADAAPEPAAKEQPSAATPRPSVSATAPEPTPRPVPTRSVSVFAGATIGIDPGHNGLNHTRPDVINRLISNGRDDDTETCNTTGTETNAGYPESAFNFNVATELAHLLRARGATVVMTRQSNDGVGPCVDERARILNDAQVDVAIDLHADGGPADGRGFAILEPVPSGTNDAVVAASLRYAELLRREFLETGMPTSTYDGEDGFKERADLGGLNLTTVPQLLLESGNMRNATDAALLTSPEFQGAAARAIMRAMGAFLTAEAGHRSR
jgi:N-acetylmuramoyl-L-alanine amidase